jgi:hypothetical protein
MESVVALFEQPDQVRNVLGSLLQRGFKRDNLGFTMVDVIAEEELASETGVSPEEGAPAGSGAVIKGSLTGILGGLALTTPVWLLLLLIPETRIYQLGGLYGMLFGVLTGAGLGGLFGSMAGTDSGDYVKLMRQMGMPAAAAEAYYDQLKSGKILVFARTPAGEKTDEAISLFKKAGALDLDGGEGSTRLTSQRGAH